MKFESWPAFYGHCERLGHGEQECFCLHPERRPVRREIGIPNQAYIPKEHKENEFVTAALLSEQERSIVVARQRDAELVVELQDGLQQGGIDLPVAHVVQPTVVAAGPPLGLHDVSKEDGQRDGHQGRGLDLAVVLTAGEATQEDTVATGVEDSQPGEGGVVVLDNSFAVLGSMEDGLELSSPRATKGGRSVGVPSPLESPRASPLR